MSLEWQNQNKEIPKPVEETEQVEREQNSEQELSPEQIEQIMNKVQDINEIGSAFTGLLVENLTKENENREININLDLLSTTLKLGLLGFTQDVKPKIGTDDVHRIKEKWIQSARTDRSNVLFSNIIGRDIESVNDSHFSSFKHSKFGVLYDIDGYEEKLPIQVWPKNGESHFSHLSKDFTTHSFRKLEDSYIKDSSGEKIFGLSLLNEKVIDILNIEGADTSYNEFVDLLHANREILIKSIPNIDEYISYVKNAKSFTGFIGGNYSDNGFLFSRRISPRRFKGLIYNQTNSKWQHPTQIEIDKKISKP